MDDMSSGGIQHLYNLINKTILDRIFNKYKSFIDTSDNSSYLSYLKKGYPKLLGIFETLKKSGTDTSSTRNRISSRPEFQNKLFEDIIYHHKPKADITGEGYSSFSIHINKKEYSPHICYGNLIKEI